MFDLADRIKGLFHSLFGAAPQDDSLREALLLKAVERVVDGLDPRLRLLGGYQDKLRPAMALALAHLEGVATRVLGPLPCSAQTWGQDPRLRALFATPADIARIFSRTDAVQAFFGQPENALAEQCHGLLIASRQERKQVGYSLHGEVLTGDVVQTAISFIHHRIALPAASPAAVRLELQLRGVDFLAEQACLHIQASGNGHTPLEARLSALSDILGNAAQLCQVRPISLHLDAMNMQTTDSADAVEFSEIEAQGRPAQVVTLVSFPRSELIDRRAMARDAARSLGV